MTIPLPFKESGLTTETLFEIDCTSGGGTAIAGSSVGTDQFGDAGTGISGSSDAGTGVYGSSQSGIGVFGASKGNVAGSAGIQAQSDGGIALYASVTGNPSTLPDTVLVETTSINHAALAAHNNAPHSTSGLGGFGVWASSNTTAIYGQGNPAGYFAGNVQVTGDLSLLGGDMAEDFDLEDETLNAEPGTVLVIRSTGKLSACAEPYDTRVAGIVSGAGDLRPAIILHRLHDRPGRSPVALVGKALCKVDAAFGEVSAGDLLTTSATPGHAMKVADPSKALGAVLGKALGSLAAGRGFVPVLVSLR